MSDVPVDTPALASRYRFRAVLEQSPEKVKTAILSILGVTLGILDAAGVWSMSPDLLETVGVGIALERLLDLFYVAPVNKAQDAVALQVLQEETLKAIDLGTQLRPRRPIQAAAP